MAVIGSTLPSHSLHLCQMKRVGIRCRSTVFNSVQTVQSSSEKTRTHLSNLEKLLQKEVTVTPQPVKPVDPEINTGQKRRGSRERRILERLNLSGLLPEGIPGLAAEVSAEMSPHRLARLQNLLSKQPEYSPRNHLGARWREYHGERDWAGLLDPLDENLRREIVRYGEFVQAAYQSFHADPATTEAGINAWRDVELIDKSYSVTKSLYATSSIGLPKWVDDVAPDLGWMTQRSSMIGYVAVCHDEKEISRMGRRDIVIALRGTSTCLEWAENMRESLVTMHENVSSENSSLESQQVKVECGFNSLFRTKGEHVPSLAESVVHEIKRLMELYKGETLSISVTGHSLGAALSLLVGNEINTCVTNSPPVAVFSFGSPRVGNRPFANLINSNNVKVLRIVNNQDLITRVPGMFFNEETERTLKKNVQWLDTMPWAYSHVGTELRVDTKMSPYLRPDADVACCHDLEAYLHLVDGFMGSNCPFRPNAKRSLLKLLSEQGANVKKLYRSKCKAKSLTLKIEGDGIVSLSSSNNLLTPSVQRE